MYVLLPELETTLALGCWAPQLPDYTHVIGYSGLGHFFLHNAKAKEYAVLYPYRRASKNYGAHESVRAFERSILTEPNFVDYVLRPKHQQAISNIIGALEPEQIYIAQPYPFLGGSEQTGSYMKGNVWVFAELVGQAHGFPSIA